jgi:hypothetical protein
MLEFYCGALGFEPFAEIFIPDGHVWGLRFGNAMLKMMYHETRPGAPAEDRVATHYTTIHVLNAKDMEKRAIAGGATILASFSTFTPARDGDPECNYVLFRDPEGNVVEFSQGSPWVAPTEEFRTLARKARNNA